MHAFIPLSTERTRGYLSILARKTPPGGDSEAIIATCRRIADIADPDDLERADFRFWVTVRAGIERALETYIAEGADPHAEVELDADTMFNDLNTVSDWLRFMAGYPNITYRRR